MRPWPEEGEGDPGGPASGAAARFAGTWDVRRRIVDHQALLTSLFAGRAVLTGTDFRETGTLRIGDRAFETSRAYRLAVSGRGIDVSRSDGSPFLCLGILARQRVRHVCGDDIYAGRFFFRSADAWAEFWRVHGPRKRYSSLSLYRRSAAS